MSRIGSKPIEIPEKTEIDISEDLIVVKGPLGELSLKFKSNNCAVEEKDGTIVVTPKDGEDLECKALWGTYASHINNMIQGVNKEYEKKLIVEGVGYKVEVKGNTLAMALGYSHPVDLEIPEGLKVAVEKNEITISGIGKEAVGQFAAIVRSKRKPEPYKGKGIRYEDEHIIRKEGKKAL